MEVDSVEKIFEDNSFDCFGTNFLNINRPSITDETPEGIIANKLANDWLEWADGLSATDDLDLDEEKDEDVSTITSSRFYFGFHYDYFIGVSIDSEKVIAAIIDDKGAVLHQCEEKFYTWAPLPGYLEQSSDQIWDKVVTAIRDVKTNFISKDIKGIAFVATSSLVVLDKFGESISVSPTRLAQHNVILWADERATEEAMFINSVGGSPLIYTVNKISANYPLAKLLWLKKYLKIEWMDYSYFFILPDFFTWKLTQSEKRSPESIFCKWNLMMDHDGKIALPEDFFREIHLYDICTSKWNEIGIEILESGSKIQAPLLPDVAETLDLEPSTAVAVGMSISKSRLLNLIGISCPGLSKHPINRLLINYGSSLTVIALSRLPNYVPNFHGPWYSILLPGLWTNKGYQKCGDRLIEYILKAYSALMPVQEKFNDRSSMHQYLETLLVSESKQKDVPLTHLTERIHICPEFNGNSSPLNDPTLTGCISGVSFSNNEASIAVLYLAALQAFAYSTRLNVKYLISRGFTEFNTVAVSGQEFSANGLQQQILADVLGMPVIVPVKEPPCLSAAILAANAASHLNKSCVSRIARRMCGPAKIIHPQPQFKEYHERKFKIYLQMIKDQNEYKKIME